MLGLQLHNAFLPPARVLVLQRKIPVESRLVVAERLFSHHHVRSRRISLHQDRDEGDPTSREQGGALATGRKSDIDNVCRLVASRRLEKASILEYIHDVPKRCRRNIFI